MGLLTNEQGLDAIKAAVKRKGVVDGSELARIFAWLRPNDLVWNYWVNNYLLGNDPPAFDILFWNADTTRLPAAFHADLIEVFQYNPYVNAGKMTVLGEPIDMSQVTWTPTSSPASRTTSRPGRRATTPARIYGAKSQFILANAGHLQSLLNPPGSAKSFFFSAKVGGPDPDAGPARPHAPTAAGGRTAWPGCMSAPARRFLHPESWETASIRPAWLHPVNT
jgi:polyhydroxyalkanoate synthase